MARHTIFAHHCNKSQPHTYTQCIFPFHLPPSQVMDHCNNSCQLENERVLLSGVKTERNMCLITPLQRSASLLGGGGGWGLMSLQKVHRWDLIPEENWRPGGGEHVSTDVYLIDREQCVGRNPPEQLWIIKEAEIFIHGRRKKKNNNLSQRLVFQCHPYASDRVSLQGEILSVELTPTVLNWLARGSFVTSYTPI